MQGLANGRSADGNKLAPSRGMRWHESLPTSVSSQGLLEVYGDPEIVELREALRVAGEAVKEKHGSVKAGLKEKDDACVLGYKAAENNFRSRLRYTFSAKLKQEQQAAIDGAAQDALQAARQGKSSDASDSPSAPADDEAPAVTNPGFNVLAAVERHEQLAQQAETTGVDMGDLLAAAAEQTAADASRNGRRELLLSCCRSVESPLQAHNRARELQHALFDSSTSTRSEIINGMCDTVTLPPSRAHGRLGEKVVNGKCPLPGCDVQGAKATAKHVHACHRRYLLAELRLLFAKTVPDNDINCMFASCNVHIASVDALGSSCQRARRTTVRRAEEGPDGRHQVLRGERGGLCLR